MRLATIQWNGTEEAALVMKDGFLPLRKLNEHTAENWPTDLFTLIETGELELLKRWLREEFERMPEGALEASLMPFSEADYAPLYRHPRKIWGIGLNYAEHAADLKQVSPDTEPASFMKPDTAIIGPGDVIELPSQSNRVTAEAELGIIIGTECKDVSREDAFDVVAGFTTIIDMTAEDILEKNPRYLTRAKSFDTFFSFGPELVTPDEVEAVLDLTVATVKNGEVHRKNSVSNMTFRPRELIAFHSEVMTLLPGDIISTGTPGAVVIRDGDVVECRIDGFKTLYNAVEDLKLTGRE
ncbi:fumarylacetoacetate hydrolase family protein [Planococcus alpniumensis]|uniref:fumarylacetoacetate hydrolase family protein n=1 Tax=Planococcus alpniumensis TaxID=2708345 RepID=UPI001B8C0BEC|nr:fumarylacetoacetate hydrolase family protein [Planococcus sp. MSAK28401]